MTHTHTYAREHTEDKGTTYSIADLFSCLSHNHVGKKMEQRQTLILITVRPLFLICLSYLFI